MTPPHTIRYRCPAAWWGIVVIYAYALAGRKSQILVSDKVPSTQYLM